jgi:hypothetical protein
MMALATGNVSIGRTPATDFIASYEFPDCQDAASEDDAIAALLERMNEQKRAFWSQTGVEPEEWPGPTMLMSLASRSRPRVWWVSMEKEQYDHREVLHDPGIRLEGSPLEVFSLLYGFRFDVLEALITGLEIDEAKLSDALAGMKVLRPVDKINLSAIPLQDAIDLAVFLANVQIEMDRFLPGEPACGGPIDVMVLRMAPTPEILSYPGKELHHPISRGKLWR